MCVGEWWLQIMSALLVVPPQVRVGVGCFVFENQTYNQAKFLIGRRKGSHGAGMLALPGLVIATLKSPFDLSLKQIQFQVDI